MAPRKPNTFAWWDESWNPFAGCSPAGGPGCDFCWAAWNAATLQKATDAVLYRGTTVWRKGRAVFNGKLTAFPLGNQSWNFPLKWPGAPKPVLGPGRPSLLWLGSTSDVFHPKRSDAIIDRAVATLVQSEHIGLILSKHDPERMAAYFLAQRAKWREKLWLGFSAERQIEFDKRWPAMRQLTQQGWFIFVSIAPMLGPVTLPDDFLSLAKWVIVAGEEGPHLRDPRLYRQRYMKPSWARAVRDKCAAARIPFFLKQMTWERPFPPGLQVQEFPKWPGKTHRARFIDPKES